MTNNLADLVQTTLGALHARVYRNKPILNPVFPYIVYRIDSVNDSYPTNDYSLDIKIFEKNDGTVSVRSMETLADNIDTVMNHQSIPATLFNAHFTRDLRQYENDSSLSGLMFVNLQYTVRLYVK